MAEDLSPAARQRALQHVLTVVHPDRREAEVVGVAPTDDGSVVGVKAHPKGYLSAASYALVTLASDGTVVDAEACTGRELRRTLAGLEQ